MPTMNGEYPYLWRAVDQDWYRLDTLMQFRRDRNDAKCVVTLKVLVGSRSHRQPFSNAPSSRDCCEPIKVPGTFDCSRRR